MLITLHVDGACPRNGRGANGMGVGIVGRCGGAVREKAKAYADPPCTNNRAELLAIRDGLRFVRETDRAEAVVTVYSDSLVSVNVLNGTNRAGANLDLIAQVRAVEREFAQVHYRWVRGHSGDADNERANELAQQATFNLP